MILAERLQNIRFSDAKGPPLYRRVYEGYPCIRPYTHGTPCVHVAREEILRQLQIPMADPLKSLVSNMVDSNLKWNERTRFQDIANGNTPFYCSIHHYSDFKSRHPSLVDNETYLILLGTGNFSLVKSGNILNEYFFTDEQLFGGVSPSRHYSSSSQKVLFPFSIMADLREQGLLHLGVATGVLQTSLGLDDSSPIPTPPTLKSTFQFQIANPHNEELFEFNGQVEVDLLIFGEVDGKATLFVIEGKLNSVPSTIAKTKLAYASMAIISSGKVPRNVNVVPVYVKTEYRKADNSFHYFISQFEMSDKVREGVLELSEFKVIPNKSRHFFIKDLY
jgi:hypothetical protein